MSYALLEDHDVEEMLKEGYSRRQIAALSREGMKELEKIHHFMKAHPFVVVTIDGMKTRFGQGTVAERGGLIWYCPLCRYNGTLNDGGCWCDSYAHEVIYHFMDKGAFSATIMLPRGGEERVTATKTDGIRKWMAGTA